MRRSPPRRPRYRSWSHLPSPRQVPSAPVPLPRRGGRAEWLPGQGSARTSCGTVAGLRASEEREAARGRCTGGPLPFRRGPSPPTVPVWPAPPGWETVRSPPAGSAITECALPRAPRRSGTSLFIHPSHPRVDVAARAMQRVRARQFAFLIRFRFAPGPRTPQSGLRWEWPKPLDAGRVEGRPVRARPAPGSGTAGVLLRLPRRRARVSRAASPPRRPFPGPRPTARAGRDRRRRGRRA